jgi:DNA replication and checkpoint protein
MTQPEKQLRGLKRRLKEWEAEFLKSHGRKATIEDIAENPSIGKSFVAHGTHALHYYLLLIHINVYVRGRI